MSERTRPAAVECLRRRVAANARCAHRLNPTGRNSAARGPTWACATMIALIALLVGLSVGASVAAHDLFTRAARSILTEAQP